MNLSVKSRNITHLYGTAFYETKLFLMKLGYSLPGAEKAALRVEDAYDLNFYRRYRYR
jgi:hypothetical protein